MKKLFALIMIFSFITSFSKANSLELGSLAPQVKVLTDQSTTLDLGEALSTGTTLVFTACACLVHFLWQLGNVLYLGGKTRQPLDDWMQPAIMPIFAIFHTASLVNMPLMWIALVRASKTLKSTGKNVSTTTAAAVGLITLCFAGTITLGIALRWHQFLTLLPAVFCTFAPL